MRKSGIAELLGDVKETITVIDNEYAKANEDLSVKEFLKIKDPKDADLKKCERTIAKVLEDYCDINGKSLVLEIARKLCKNNSLRDIVSWTFSINEVYEDNMYDWMY